MHEGQAGGGDRRLRGKGEALRRLFTALPRGQPVPMFVVPYVSPAKRSLLADIIGRTTAAPVLAAQDGMPVRDGTIYVAPPDRHLIALAARPPRLVTCNSSPRPTSSQNGGALDVGVQADLRRVPAASPEPERRHRHRAQAGELVGLQAGAQVWCALQQAHPQTAVRLLRDQIN